MKDLNMLVWLTQLGLSVALPLAGFTCLGVWLRKRFELGSWVVVLGLIIGFLCAVDGFRSSLKLMERMDQQNRPDHREDSSQTVRVEEKHGFPQDRSS